MVRKWTIQPHFVDVRGEITNLLEVPIRHITLITSKAGAIRGNHVHKEDSHYSYLLSGRFTYTEGKTKEVEQVTITSGDMVHSPAGVPHAMHFLEDSVFLAFTTRERDAGKYDDDTREYVLIG